MRKPIILGDFAQYSHLPYEERQTIFQEARLHGLDGSVQPFAVGGSDVAAIFGESPWVTAPALHAEKWGLKSKKSDGPKDVFVKGHMAEDFVRNMFEYYNKDKIQKTIANTLQFRHPLYPHVVVNPDGFVIDLDGCLGIYEGKTVNPFSDDVTDYWKKGLVPPYYDLQGRYYMGTCDVDFCWFACAWGLNKNEMAWVKITRDRKLETVIFEGIEEWVRDSIACRSKNILPKNGPLNHADLVSQDLQRRYGDPVAGLSPIRIPASLESAIIAIADIQRKIEAEKKLKSASESILRDLERQLIAVSCPVLDQMGSNPNGLYTMDNGVSVKFSFDISGKMALDKGLLKSRYPAIYNEVYTPSNNRTLKVTITGE